jgi:TonB-dependent receptor
MLCRGITLALLMPFGALAQTAPDSAPADPAPATDATTLDAVTVTGVRASLARSVELKRSASTVQDSITALELGKFPDDNVADSLSHITGVAISRTAGGEGQSVSVRGLGPEYTLTTFNGRILATDGPGRDFAFDVLPADVISGADVIKGAEAGLTEGAIGGLVNLRSASPFDDKGQHAVLRVEGDRNTMSDLNGTKYSGVYSNTFADDTVGILLGAVYADRTDRTDVAGNDGGWTRNPDPSDPSWGGNAWGGNIDLNDNGELDPDEYGLIAPGQFRVGSIMEDKKRRAYTGKFEWRPSDSFRLTIDGLKTKLDSPQVSYQQSYYPLFSPGRWSNIQVNNGIVTSFDMTNPDPEMRLNPELLNQTTYRVVDTDLYGANARWQVSDDFAITGDFYRSTSQRTSGGLDTYVVLRMNQPNSAHISLSGQAVPNVGINFDDGREWIQGLENGDFNESDFDTHYFGLSGDNIQDEINGGTLSGDLFLGKWNVDHVKFGVSLTDRRKTRDLVNNAFNGGENYYSNDNKINVADLDGDIIDQTLSPPNFMSGVSSSFPRNFLGFDVPSYIRALQAYDGQPSPDGGVYDYANAAPEWNPLESYRVREKTTAVFLQANMSGEHWDGNFGIRFGTTKTRSQAWDAKIESITELGAFNYSVQYGEPTPILQDASYSFYLPSANFTWHFTDELQLRVGAAKTMARPSVEQLAPTNTTASVAWGEFTQIYGGNTDLKPYSAKQGDLSLEWYFSDKSIFNLATFYKRIDNQITTSWEPQQDIGVPGYLFNVMRPINGDYAKVHGIEAGAQHFWDNGFGVRGQYTRNWSKSFVDGEERPLEGIAPSVYSLGVMYEKGAWSIGAQADHTDGFVTATNVLGQGYNEQADAITWVTAHVSYTVNDHFSVTLEGDNLLDDEQTYSINGNPLLSQGYYRYGRSFKLSLALKF